MIGYIKITTKIYSLNEPIKIGKIIAAYIITSVFL